MPPPRALFEPVDDGCWLPTPLARGPWDPSALHGGPVAALVAGAIESVEAPGAAEPMHPARLTLELLRAVPLEPLQLRTEVVRPGKRVQLVAATLTVAATAVEVARALVLRIRENPAARPAAEPVHDPTPHGPEHGTPPAAFLVPDSATATSTGIAFHSHAVEHRFVAGNFDERGPATDWIRLVVPVVPDRPPSPWQRVVAAADFGNGISGVLDPGAFTFVNPDLTVTLARLPRGEWVCLQAATLLGADGVATAESALFDEQGRLGRSVQCVLVAPR